MRIARIVRCLLPAAVAVLLGACAATGTEPIEAVNASGSEMMKAGPPGLYRFHPGAEHPFHLDSRAPKIPLSEFTAKEARFAMLTRARPGDAERLAAEAQASVEERRRLYEQLAAAHDTASEEPEQ